MVFPPGRYQVLHNGTDESTTQVGQNLHTTEARNDKRETQDDGFVSGAGLSLVGGQPSGLRRPKEAADGGGRGRRLP